MKEIELDIYYEPTMIMYKNNKGFDDYKANFDGEFEITSIENKYDNGLILELEGKNKKNIEKFINKYPYKKDLIENDIVKDKKELKKIGYNYINIYYYLENGRDIKNQIIL